MTLHYGSLYWPSTWPDSPRYPHLTGTASCDVLIVGGGMSGAVCGLTLARSGLDAALIEQGEIASGSSSSNTGLIQYSNDITLSDLARQIGEKDAVCFYRACKNAVEHMGVVAGSLPRDVEFNRRSSFYFASAPEDAKQLREEYELLDRHNFGAEWWDEDQIAARFPFRKEAAIVTHGDAELNPYRFVCTMVEAAAKEGLAVYEHTPMLSIEREDGRFAVRTGEGLIRANRIVLAVGYTPESAGSKRVLSKLNRSYAIATKPLPDLSGWHERFMLWETARPYLYLRATPDGRIVAGGLDEPQRQPVLTAADLRQRSQRLLAEIVKLFPDLRPELAFEWCATFGESADNLPWIGEDPDRPGIYLLLGYGGNGSVYSTIGAQLIRDLLIGEENPLARIVSPRRTCGGRGLSGSRGV
ncbi:FAD-dependent oxidoreductase [Cohnella lubricantis]|uniref:NAD(P)/FAD-dependent oxidoreductase n=1 Tax=Cohnella lubricantis TaxID=2163172 RepID=UPI001FD95550|nr:FAD-dependent oxidoreductase [Cohnella lubricantis]MBP2119947.1 glycine/D-amino acid oxidase-like deaminating enzyme [Cohnella lubricantis]